MHVPVFVCVCVFVGVVGAEVGDKRKRAQSFRRWAVGAYKTTHFADQAKLT